MEEVVGSIPTRSTKFSQSFCILRFLPFRLRRAWRSGSGFRQLAHGLTPLGLTPAKRLKFDPDQVHQIPTAPLFLSPTSPEHWQTGECVTPRLYLRN